ncbi:MAG: class I SAM-dependent methyltransferase [Acidobacteriota bacterium]|nr:class I SAM-dependent methyltransferase [Acidobacteriota bacterium]
MNEFLENNRSLWNGWTRLHEKSALYDLDNFKAGRSSLKPVELEELGEVAGQTLLHLQCHFGMDTLSWARLGARVTGVDFSAAAVALARSLSAEVGISADFICSNLYDLPRALEGEFDIVFTSYGVLSWLPDLDRWAEIVAHYLKPGGTFYIVEFHPFASMLDDDGTTFKYAYFHTSKPIELQAQGSYAAPNADFTHAEYNWAHSLSDVINAVLRAGLRLEFVHEFPFSSYQTWPSLEEIVPDKFQLKNADVTLPLMFSLRATR